MALTFHLPKTHLPHAEDISKHSNIIIAGLLAASVGLATVVVARSVIGDSMVSTSTTATEISATPIVTPTKMADRFGPATASISADTGSLVDIAPHRALAGEAVAAAPVPSITADTGEFLGAYATGAVDTSSSMAVFGTDNPAIVASSPAPIAADTGEFLGAFAGRSWATEFLRARATVHRPGAG